MPEYKLSDEQWCLLDLLMRAKQRGVERLSRMELLSSKELPQGAALKLTFAALVMPKELVTWHGQHDFAITPAGASLYNLRFDTPKPTQIADAVICLPGPTAQH